MYNFIILHLHCVYTYSEDYKENGTKHLVASELECSPRVAALTPRSVYELNNNMPGCQLLNNRRSTLLDLV